MTKSDYKLTFFDAAFDRISGSENTSHSPWWSSIVMLIIQTVQDFRNK